jgi:hypothetical protein
MFITNKYGSGLASPFYQMLLNPGASCRVSSRYDSITYTVCVGGERAMALPSTDFAGIAGPRNQGQGRTGSGDPCFLQWNCSQTN